MSLYVHCVATPFCRYTLHDVIVKNNSSSGVLRTIKITKKHMPFINQFYSHDDTYFYTYNMASQHIDITAPHILSIHDCANFQRSLFFLSQNVKHVYFASIEFSQISQFEYNIKIKYMQIFRNAHHASPEGNKLSNKIKRKNRQITMQQIFNIRKSGNSDSAKNTHILPYYA